MMIDERHKVFALALALANATESPLADLVPAFFWDRLHDEGLLRTVRDPTDEGVTTITEAGIDWLRASLGFARRPEPVSETRPERVATCHERVACPRCRADIGDRCKMVVGGRVRDVDRDPHLDRVRADGIAP